MKWITFTAAILLLTPCVALAGSVDLNDFFADPIVFVAGDGSSALMSEDPVLSPVLLANDPGFGDPIVIFSPPDDRLLFDFVFTLGGPFDQDEFGAFLIDPATGFSYLLPGTEFFTSVPAAGTVAFDLTGLPPTLEEID